VPKADLVLEGGGMKGLGLVGAAVRLLEDKYTFPRVAGTSVGSIVGAFLAAGVDAGGLKKGDSSSFGGESGVAAGRLMV